MTEILAKGTATITAGLENVVIPHGLSEAPDLEDIGLTPQISLDGMDYYPSAPDATNFTINISGPLMHDASFSWFIVGAAVVGESESDFCDKVRHKINADEADISDAIVLEYVADAVAYVQSETGAAINYLSCTALEEVAIKDLAALNCYCYLFGGDLASISSDSTTENTTNMGYNLGDYGYRVGDASRNLVNNGTVIKNLEPAIQIIKEEFDRAIAQLKLH
ncbi:hypothetical protein MUP79_05405 [Candidatus Bathyarchaeota archaeon]|nr:hypothetical protein [Candidatus Bathyarchaeota archaeon]